MNCLLLPSAVCLLRASAARRLSASISVHPRFLSLPSTYRCSVAFVTSWLNHVRRPTSSFLSCLPGFLINLSLLLRGLRDFVVKSWLDNTSLPPTYPAPRTISNKHEMKSTRQIPTRCAPWISAQQTMWVNEGKMFGPKPSLFPRVLHQHFPTHFEYFKKNSFGTPRLLSHSFLPSAFCCLPHSPLPTPH